MKILIAERKYNHIQVVVAERIHFQRHLAYQRHVHHYNETTDQTLVKKRNIERKQNGSKNAILVHAYVKSDIG